MLSILALGVMTQISNELHIEQAHEERINSIRKEYELTKNLPRKLKKVKRKKLLYSYSFFINIKEYWDKNLRLSL